MFKCILFIADFTQIFQCPILTIIQQQSRYWLGAKQATSHYLKWGAPCLPNAALGLNGLTGVLSKQSIDKGVICTQWITMNNSQIMNVLALTNVTTPTLTFDRLFSYEIMFHTRHKSFYVIGVDADQYVIWYIIHRFRQIIPKTFYTPAIRSCWGYICFTPSVCPSVCPSFRPSVPHPVSAL